MAKKKKAPVLEAWCWYCDRDFEDDKVLLQHQRAKHYRCPQCPRKLNTAGGLTVHLHQVHKAEPGRIENALPGRESFDMEIYGMAGIPAADLAEWKARKAAANGQAPGQGPPPSKKPKIESVALTPEQLKAQLEAHKALMSGKSANPSSSGAAAPAPPSSFGPPQPFAPSGPGYPQGVYGGPPPNMAPAGGFVGPPPGYGMPPVRPGFPAGPPPPQPFGYGGPPPSVAPGGYGAPAYPQYGMGPRQWGGQPGFAAGPPPTPPQPQYSPHQIAVRTGAKSRMVYSDKEISPEEKLASMGKYRYVDPEDEVAPSQVASTSQVPYQPPPVAPAQDPSYYQQQQQAPQQQYQNYNQFQPPPQQAPIRPPHPSYGPPPTNAQSPQAQRVWGQPSSSSPAPAPAPQVPNGSPAQAYPAIAPGALPPSAQPEANTAEALAQANAHAGENNANGDGSGGVQEREQDVKAMVDGAEKEEKQDKAQGVDQPMVSATDVGATDGGGVGTSTSTETATRSGRKRAADLF